MGIGREGGLYKALAGEWSVGYDSFDAEVANRPPLDQILTIYSNFTPKRYPHATSTYAHPRVFPALGISGTFLCSTISRLGPPAHASILLARHQQGTRACTHSFVRPEQIAIDRAARAIVYRRLGFTLCPVRHLTLVVHFRFASAWRNGYNRYSACTAI